MRHPFRFKQFNVRDDNCAMKLTSDGVLLGAWTIPGNASRILDIGTGSGILALMMAQKSKALIDAVDIHAGSCFDASYNFRNSPWNNRLQIYNLSYREFIQINNKKYDLIITNPPFYNNSLKSPSHHINISKHTTSLSHNELLYGIKSLLNPEGIFSIILPFSEFEKFIQLSTIGGLHCIHKCLVFPSLNKAANRVLAKFSLDTRIHVQNSELTIYSSYNEYSESYKNLTKDFYLNF